MRIGCLQFAPQLGDVDHNLSRADAVLSKASPQDLDLLVLPELAFSGYNFKSLKHITPYLEPTASGISSLWARTTALKYDCVVTVGYPEKVDISPNWPTSPEYYNSTITVNGDGETIANYRKSFLYYTDETWALEGPDGFYDGEVEGLGNVAMGICMDLNPYKFEAPWSAWEFAYHILHRQANLAVISMAWLTREDARSYSRSPKEPDMETLAYWVARLEPLIRAEGEDEIIVVFANRSGVEGEAVYAGSSAVLGIQRGEVKLYGVLGRGERELLVVDTSKRPQAKLVHDAHTKIPESTKYETLNDSQTPRDSNSSKASTTSKSSHNTATSNASTAATNGSAYDDDELDLIASIGEVLAAAVPLSPVEPRNPHAFFHNGRTADSELQPLKSTIEVRQDVPDRLKDVGLNGNAGSPQNSPKIPFVAAASTAAQVARVIDIVSGSNETRRPLRSAVNNPLQQNRALTPGPEDQSNGVFERPSSPKSRNASRTRSAVTQEQALYTHDLAGDESFSTISRNGRESRNGSFSRHMTPSMVRGGNTSRNAFRSDEGPHSAGEIKLPPGIEIVYTPDQSEDEDGMLDAGFFHSPPRPKSVGW